MPVVVYTTSNGWDEFREVIPGTPPSAYERGIRLGPPDLSDLGLDDDQTRTLNNRLVAAGLLDFKSLHGMRGTLRGMLEGLVEKDEIARLRVAIVACYQRDYYPELFEEYDPP